jgi:hypothetical protein
MISFAYPKRFDEPFDTGERIFGQAYLLYASAGAFHLDVEQRSWLLPPGGADFGGHADPHSQQCRRHFGVGAVRARMRGTAFAALPGIPGHAADRGNDSIRDPLGCAAGGIGSKLATVSDRLGRRRWRSCRLRRRPVVSACPHGGAGSRSELYAGPSRRGVEFFGRGQSSHHVRAYLVTALRRRIQHELVRVRAARVVVKATERLAMSRDQVVQIAHETGFSSASLFAQAFRQVMGETPTQYRRRLG